MVLVVEHESSRGGRWLRRHRTRLALWIAVLEAILVVVGAVPRWPAFFVALALIAFYVVVGRSLRSDTLRQASWIAAASQLLIAALPLLIAVLTLAAIIVVRLLAVVAIDFVFLGRR